MEHAIHKYRPSSKNYEQILEITTTWNKTNLIYVYLAAPGAVTC